MIKGDKRSTLSNEALDDLLLNPNVSMQDFNPDRSVDLWWELKTRRPQLNPRKKYEKHQSIHSSRESEDHEPTTDSDSSQNMLDKWANWFEESEPSESDSE